MHDERMRDERVEEVVCVCDARWNMRERDGTWQKCTAATSHEPHATSSLKPTTNNRHTAQASASASEHDATNSARSRVRSSSIACRRSRAALRASSQTRCSEMSALVYRVGRPRDASSPPMPPPPLSPMPPIPIDSIDSISISISRGRSPRMPASLSRTFRVPIHRHRRRGWGASGMARARGERERES